MPRQRANFFCGPCGVGASFAEILQDASFVVDGLQDVARKVRTGELTTPYICTFGMVTVQGAHSTLNYNAKLDVLFPEEFHAGKWVSLRLAAPTGRKKARTRNRTEKRARKLLGRDDEAQPCDDRPISLPSPSYDRDFQASAPRLDATALRPFQQQFQLEELAGRAKLGLPASQGTMLHGSSSACIPCKRFKSHSCTSGADCNYCHHASHMKLSL